MKLNDFEDRGSAVQSVIRSFREGTFPHALLICGEEGIGKRSLARLFVQGLLCVSDSERPCGTCKGCKRVTENRHPNLLLPEKTEKTKGYTVDSLRKILDSLSRFAFEDKNRVVFLEEAHRMNIQAQNCILKSIEECDGHTYFILVSNKEAAILPTIRSRCRILHMGTLEEKKIESIIASQCDDPDERKRIALDARGSIGRAKQMLDDSEYERISALCEKTFLSVSRLSQVASMSKQLKDEKDNAGIILDLLDVRWQQMISGNGADYGSKWSGADRNSLNRLRQELIDCQMKLASNVGWPAVAENLMLKIIKEIQTW